MLSNFSNWLVELNMAQARKATDIFLSSGGKKRYEEIFKGQDRIYYDFKSKKEVTSNTMSLVVEALDKEGYILLDYVQGLCYLKADPKRQLKVQRVLFKLGEEQLAQKMNIDPVRDSSKTSGMKVVLSRHGIDIAGQSTDRSWNSCKELSSGINAHYVWKEISAGMIVAYLIKSDDTNIKKPIARLSLGVFKLKEDEKVIAFFPTSAVYGNFRDQSFYDFIIDWCTETNKTLNSLPGDYFLDPACHTDTTRTLKVYGDLSLKDYLEQIQKKTIDAKINLSKDELPVDVLLEIFDAISKMPENDASATLKGINLNSSTVAEILEKGDIRDIKRMQIEFSSSLGVFLKLSEKDWNKISSKRKREIYDIYEELIGGKEAIEEVLSATTSSASKFLKIAYAEKYK
jgi:hypothetical protein